MQSRLSQRLFSSSSSRSIGNVIKNYEGFLSTKSANRKPSAIRALQPLVNLPGMISLGGGMPNPETFPISQVSFQLKNSDESIQLSPQLMQQALQYSNTAGLDCLTTFILDNLIHKIHHPPQPVSLSITTGSQDALTKAFDMFLTDSNCSLLVEKPTYSGSLAHLHANQHHLIGIDTDEFGLIPEQLEYVLQHPQHWKGKNKPKVLYTIPTGSNPTGCSLSYQRKQAIYHIAQQHNLIILEDDPYYYLSFNDEQQKSFLSLDVDSRVLRFDSFSKILSSGLRIGFVTGPDELINRINLHSQSANLHPSGISQAIVFSLLEKWGEQGWQKHITEVRHYYQQRRDMFVKYLTKHLTGLAKWTVPQAGMFVWIELLGVEDSLDLIEKGAIKKKVILVPGAVFLPNENEKSNFVRAAFSTASEEDMDIALQRLAALLMENQSDK